MVKRRYFLWIFLLASAKLSISIWAMSAVFDGKENLSSIEVKLTPLGKKFNQVTEIQFWPNRSSSAFVLEKTGNLFLVQLQNHRISQNRVVKKFAVNSASEMGLLGIALPQDFEKSGEVFISYNPQGRKISRFSRFFYTQNTLVNEQVLLEVNQPYVNHNGGQIHYHQGMLYIALGDGGSANDPHNHGQNRKSLLGKILRLDVRDKKVKYKIPVDNPFVQNKNYLPEIFIEGVRNPWKFQVLSDKRLIVADVGQNEIEEISVAKGGDNLGWKVYEGDQCFQNHALCGKLSNVQPVHVYNHSVGQSITGGYWLKKSGYNKLGEKYIFGDFVSGRIWALQFNSAFTLVEKVFTLGKWPMNISTFALSPDNRLYVADFSSGNIYLITD